MTEGLPDETSIDFSFDDMALIRNQGDEEWNISIESDENRGWTRGTFAIQRACYNTPSINARNFQQNAAPFRNSFRISCDYFA
ncbi:hypothetical protein G3O00_36590 [Burkholderia sp. Ac-20384]|uniref:hypothetical protein n=1 Tax=Burkholderia sp. Ac-20384 TaxID=2703902 RepID=UPI00197FC09B|nr:hypothetical protein [Burkholderia sp. Ac-20384]MBN3829082.1 hypothetical protein [Burkholderia sp. Ac-20384]